MERILASIKIMRPVNFLITFIAVIIAGIIASSASLINLKLIYAAWSMGFVCSAGNIINDIYDFEIDKINKPKRILPQKLLSITFAKILYIFLQIFGLFFAGLNGIESFIFVLIVSVIVFVYSHSLKKIILVSNITVALLTASALIYGAMVENNIAAGIIPALFAFFTNLIRELTKDIEDIEGDSAYGIKTVANHFGIKKTLRVINSLTAISIIGCAVPYFLNYYDIKYFVLIMVIVNPIFVYTIKLTSKPFDHKNISRISLLVKLNMFIGLLAILSGA